MSLKVMYREEMANFQSINMAILNPLVAAFSLYLYYPFSQTQESRFCTLL
jgi:hypothetical protein